jgi:type II secretory pathway component PulF
MPNFRYTARNSDGKDITGSVSAPNKREALSVLANQSTYPLHIEEVKTRGGDRRRRRVKQSAAAEVMKQMADLLNNGVAMLPSIEIIVDQCSPGPLRDAMVDLRDRISDGEAIDSAFAAQPNVFDELTISIVRAGAEGAFLEDSLQRAATFIDRQTEMQAKLLGAMIYPIILMFMGLFAMIGMLIFLVPKFQTMFDRLIDSGGTLPFPTVVTLGVSNTLFDHWWKILIILAIVIIWGRSLLRARRIRKHVDWFKLKIPIVGNILLLSSIAKFTRVLGTLLANGVPMLRSLEISSESTGNLILADAIREAADSVASGETLAQPLSDAGLIPKPIMAMIVVAEESNNLENVLINISENLDGQLNRKIDVAVRLVEPLMLVLIGMNLAFIILGLLLPVFRLQEQLG